MAQFVHYSMCGAENGSQYIGHNERLLFDQTASTVSTEHFRQQSERKRPLSDGNDHIIIGTQSHTHNNEHKKLKQCDDNDLSSAPYNMPPTNRLESLILELSLNLNNVSQKLERRIDELETILRKGCPNNYQKKYP